MFWIFIFIFALYILLYLPGRVFLSILKIKVSPLETLLLALVSGMALSVFFSLITDVLHIRWLFIFLLCLSTAIAYRRNVWHLSIFSKQEIYITLCLTLAAILFCFPMWWNGRLDNTIYLQNAHYSDAPLHLSLINELVQTFPLQNPGFAGSYLTGYHFFSDYLFSLFVRIFHIPSMLLYFQFYPFVTAFLWAGGTFFLIYRWTRSLQAAGISTFMTMFSGSFAFLLPLFGYTGASWDSGFGMLQPAVSLVNPPFAQSIVLLSFILYAFLHFSQTKKKSWFIFMMLLGGIAGMFKIYAGIICIAGVGLFIAISSIILMIRNRLTYPRNTIMALCKHVIEQQKTYILLIVGMTILFITIYFPFTGSSGYLIFYPLWAPHEIMRHALTKWNYDDQVAVYMHYHMWHRLAFLEISGIVVFILGNIGTRVIGIVSFFLFKKSRILCYSEFGLLLGIMTGISFFIPFLFIQSIKVFEITQMFNYFLFFLSLFAGTGFAMLWKSMKSRGLRSFIFITIFVLAVISTVYSYVTYAPSVFPAISSPEIYALDFLKKDPVYAHTVLEMPSEDFLQYPLAIKDWYPRSKLFIQSYGYKRGFLQFQNITEPKDLADRMMVVSAITQLQTMTVTENAYDKQSDEVKALLNKHHIYYIWSTYPLKNSEEIGYEKIYNKKAQGKEIYIYQRKDIGI